MTWTRRNARLRPWANCSRTSRQLVSRLRVEQRGREEIPLLSEAIAGACPSVEASSRCASRSRRYPDSMLSVVRAFGHDTAQLLVEVYCPMAFNDAGAAWLQAGTRYSQPVLWCLDAGLRRRSRGVHHSRATRLSRHRMDHAAMGHDHEASEGSALGMPDEGGFATCGRVRWLPRAANQAC